MNETGAGGGRGGGNKAWWDALDTCLGFFTRLSLRPAGGLPLAQATVAFAPVGALIGLAVGLSFMLLTGLGLPALAAALAAVCIGVALTGALHEDGLADCADALGSRDGTEQRLAIMRDSRIGSFAGLALIFSVGLRAAALASLGGFAALAACIAAHGLSRGYLPSVMAHQQLARPDGLAAAAGTPSEADARRALAIGLAVALVPAILVSPIGSIVAMALALAAMAGASALARRAFGGYTGDVLGAIQQCGEVAMLLGWAMMMGMQ